VLEAGAPVDHPLGVAALRGAPEVLGGLRDVGVEAESVAQAAAVRVREVRVAVVRLDLQELQLRQDGASGRRREPVVAFVPQKSSGKTSRWYSRKRAVSIDGLTKWLVPYQRTMSTNAGRLCGTGAGMGGRSPARIFDPKPHAFWIPGKKSWPVTQT
jgi:hypothetical protein